MHFNKDTCFLDGLLYCDLHDCEQCQKEEDLLLEKWLDNENADDNASITRMHDSSNDKNQP